MRNSLSVTRYLKTRHRLLPSGKNISTTSSSPTPIMKQIKKLAVSTSETHNYLNSYQNATQSPTFYLPGVTQYPIKKNFKFIPLSSAKKPGIQEITSYQHSRCLSVTSRSDNTTTASGQFFSAKNIKQNLVFRNASARKRIEAIETEVFEKCRYKYFEEMLNNNMKKYSLSNYDLNGTNLNSDKILGTLKEKLKAVLESQNSTYEKTKEFYILTTKDKFNFTLSCQSIFIEFVNRETKMRQELYLPFNILPMYYLLEWTTFKTFLSSILLIDKGKITIQYDNFSQKYSGYLTYINQNFFSPKFKNITFYQNEKLYLLNYPWLAPEGEIYDVTLHLPCIKLKITEGSIKFKKIISKYLLIHLILNNFSNWENEITSELFLNKKFRHIIRRIIVGRYQQSKNISLDNNINLSIFTNSKKYEFFMTVENDYENLTLFKTIAPHQIIVDPRGKPRVFSLTMSQMKNLAELRKYWSYQEIFRKCCFKTPSGMLTFNLHALNELPKEFITTLKKEGKIPLNNLHSFKLGSSQIEVQEPTIWHELIDHRGDYEIIKCLLPAEISAELIKKEVSKWDTVITENIDNLTELVPITNFVENPEGVPTKKRSSIKYCRSNSKEGKKMGYGNGRYKKSLTKQATFAGKFTLTKKIFDFSNSIKKWK